MNCIKRLNIRRTSAFCRSFFLIGVIAYTGLVTSTLSANQTEKKGTNHLVIISGFEFKPKELKVAKGDTVTWLNKDSAPHNVTISVSKKMISPNLMSNQKFTYRVDNSFDYLCGLHPPMTGKIIIKPNQD